MVKSDAIEGIVDDVLRFHYDIFADVLYLRLISEEASNSYGDMTDEGDLLLRDERSDKPAGLTVVSWWKQFGQGSLPDSISEIQRHIQPLANRVAV
jgi:hypothetical protein